MIKKIVYKRVTTIQQAECRPFKPQQFKYQYK
jgi:hypothetical protein